MGQIRKRLEVYLKSCRSLLKNFMYHGECLNTGIIFSSTDTNFCQKCAEAQPFVQMAAFIVPVPKKGKRNGVRGGQYEVWVLQPFYGEGNKSLTLDCHFT